MKKLARPGETLVWRYKLGFIITNVSVLLLQMWVYDKIIFSLNFSFDVINY